MSIMLKKGRVDFLEDIDVTKFTTKRKTDNMFLSFRPETFEILCKNVSSKKLATSVSLYEVKDIRRKKKAKDFEKHTKRKHVICATRCFTIYYGQEFRLKTLSVAATNTKYADMWISGLKIALDEKPSSYFDLLDTWMEKQFHTTKPQSGALSLKHMKDFTNRINFKISTGKLQDKIQQYIKNTNSIGFSEFSLIVRGLLHDRQIFTDCFGLHTLGSQVDLNVFQEFLRLEQNENNYGFYFPFFREYFKSGNLGTAYMSEYEGVDYLFSKENQVWDPKYAVVYQDMHRPLSHYWIASSHNTYLTGDQLSSESSVEAYIRCLRMGCRCIELDCWDGPDDTPVIYHGRTLTTKICFLKVLKAIKDYAFETSPYPVILSLDNHCSLKQQKIMAEKFQKVFGKALVMHHVSKDEDCLPSPEQLKGKIILKHKRLPKDIKHETVLPAINSSSLSERESAIDLFDTVKTGKMCILGPNERWDPYFFALTDKRLIYTEIKCKGDSQLERSDTRHNQPALEDLHYSKKWFHGRLLVGKKTAEERVLMFGVEGCFLVRMSETFPNQFALCFLSGGRAYHVHITTNSDQTQFCLVASRRFDSLYALIAYYKKNPLETKDFCIERFTKAVPQPEKHESNPWFYPNPIYPDKMDRKGAEAILQKIPLNGAFLVRYATPSAVQCPETTLGRFVISFRLGNQIKHCRIKEDGRLLVVSSKSFESIEKLVNHYSSNAFYKNLRLKHPVAEELIKFSQLVENPEKVYSSPDYLTDDDLENKIQVRAIVPHHPNDPENLSFEKDEIITNVVKHDGGWWKGDIEERRQFQKSFPANFVEEIVELDSPFGALQKGSVSVGNAEIERNPNNTMYPYIVNVNPLNRLPFKAAVSSYEEALEWQNAIVQVHNKNKDKNNDSNKIQKKNEVAKELSRLIIYCAAVERVPLEEIRRRSRMFTEMTSYSEITAEKIMSADPAFFRWLHELSRIYPKGQRIDSSNYNPMRYWNFGCHIVALNYQTADRPMQLNHGKFRQNGSCGYVLKPEYFFKRNFDPTSEDDLKTNNIMPLILNITIIAARHLSRQNKKARITNSFVEIEICGAHFDCAKVRTTKVIPDNGLNPFWNEKFTLTIKNPELALIRFAVHDNDSFGDAQFLGQATYPASQLRTGYRSVPLENGYGESLLSGLLIHLSHRASARKNFRGQLAKIYIKD